MREGHVSRKVLSITIRYQKIDPKSKQRGKIRSRTYYFGSKEKAQEEKEE